MASSPPPCEGQVVGSIASNFNGTDIAGTSHIWFNAHLKGVMLADGFDDTPEFTLHMKNSRISMDSEGTPYSVQLPDLELTFSDSVTEASGSFVEGKWVVTLPKGESDTFMGGWMADVPDGGIPGGANPVTWTAEFSSSLGEVDEVQWQWSAAVYENAPGNPNALGVLFMDGEKGAGTPMNFREAVTGGARGGGGSNCTGSWSSTKAVKELAGITPSGAPGTDEPPTGEIVLARNLVVNGAFLPINYEIVRPPPSFGFISGF